MATKLVNGVQVEMSQQELDDFNSARSSEQTVLTNNAYKFNRLSAYPALCEQLDMLWHAIDTNTLNQTSDFYLALKAVKDTYPKPV